MKQLFALLSVFFVTSSQAALTLNVQTDLHNYTYNGSPIADCSGSAGDGATVGSIKKILEINKYVGAGKRNNARLTLLMPDGFYLLDTTLYPGSNVTFQISDGAILYSTANSQFGIGGNMFEVIGATNVKFIGEPGATFTNNFSKFINAFVQFKASGQNTGNGVWGMTLKNSWCFGALMGAQTADSLATNWTDLAFVNDSIYNIYNPSKPSMLSEADYGTNADCSGVHIQQAYRNVLLDRLYINNTGGDNIRGYGWNKGLYYLFKDSKNGGIEIKNCSLARGNMNVEINGNYPAPENIHDNTFMYATLKGGSNLSTQGRPLLVKNNTATNYDGWNFELSMYGGEVCNNTTNIVAWKASMDVYQHIAYATNGKAFNVNLYGFCGNIHNNEFNCDTAGKGASSPTQWNGITAVRRATYGDTAYDRAKMGGYTSGLMGGFVIHHNTFNGQTHSAYDNTNDATENMVFTDNIINGYSHYGTVDVVTVQGYGAKVLRNYFNMKGCTDPTTSVSLVKRLGGYGEVVQDNIVAGSAVWYNKSSAYYKFLQQ